VKTIAYFGCQFFLKFGVKSYGLEFKFWSKIYERKFKLMIEIIVVMAPMWWPPYWFGLIIYAKYGYKFYFCSIIYGT
jgi:hypothetical protein